MFYENDRYKRSANIEVLDGRAFGVQNERMVKKNKERKNKRKIDPV